jgi:hypothetical protein
LKRRTFAYLNYGASRFLILLDLLELLIAAIMSLISFLTQI